MYSVPNSIAIGLGIHKGHTHTHKHSLVKYIIIYTDLRLAQIESYVGRSHINKIKYLTDLTVIFKILF